MGAPQDDSLLAGLNPSQRQAASHLEGPLMVLAGPGSGKTRVTVHRIANLLRHGVDSSQIVGLTFTNKAGEEMRLRLQRLIPGAEVWLGTYHSFCCRLLRQYAGLVGYQENFSIYDRDDSVKAMSRVLEEYSGQTMESPQSLLNRISDVKGKGVDWEAFRGTADAQAEPTLADLFEAYQRELILSNAMDFDDLLLNVAVLLRDNPELQRQLDAHFQHVLVDEYQDTNRVQYQIVAALCQQHRNLAVTGDPDQSIYGWRGATVENLFQFERDFPEFRTVKLEQNYRSTQSILAVADHLISFNRQRRPKKLLTDQGAGRPVRLVNYPSDRDEARQIVEEIAHQVHTGLRRASDFAIFYRTNALSRQFEDALREHSLPYQILRGVEFYQRKEIKDLVAYLHLANNPNSNAAFMRVVNTPPRGIGKTTLNRLREYASRHGKSLMQAAREVGLIESIKNRSAVSVTRFVALLDQFSVAASGAVATLTGEVLEATQYRDWLAQQSDESQEERVANVDEFVTATREFDERHGETGGLDLFLQRVSLVSDTDDWEGSQDLVTMMTLHASKGLEFPIVYMIGVEEGLLPHERSRSEVASLEEERRLMFVGITRAEQELQLSYCDKRMYMGGIRFPVPSSFLMELPRHEMEFVQLGKRPPRTTWDDSHDGIDDLSDLDLDEEPLESWQIDEVRPAEPQSEPVDEGAAGQQAWAEERDSFEFGANRDSGRTVEPTGGDTDPQGGSATGSGRSGHKRAAVPTSITMPTLRTASEMAGGRGAGSHVSPEVFQSGMLVSHPEYGLGKILTITGKDKKRTATIQFFQNLSQRTIRLAFCALEPVASKDA